MIGDLFDSPWKILIVAIVIIVMFGSRKLPGAARSLGQSMRILKKEMTGLHEDDEPESSAPAAFQATTTQAAQAAPVELPASTAAPDAQAQITALQAQLNSLQQTVGSNSAAPADTQQTR
jgi:sec-independent protein translocase protein TatA